MSKLIDRLRKTTQAAPRRLGFTPTSAETTVASPILLLAEVDTLDDDRAVDEAGIGVDAIFWRASQPPDLAALAVAAKSGTLPIGLPLASVAPEKWAELQDDGCDFMVVGPDAPSRALDVDTLGRVLEVSLTTDDLLLRTIEQLPVDAVLVHEGITQQAELTIERLMSYQRLSLLAHRPVILPVDSELDPNELGLLRDVGVRAILVRDDSPRAHDMVGALRQALNAIPPRKRRREERPEAIVPPPAHPMEHEGPIVPGEPEEVPYVPDRLTHKS